LNGRQIAEAFLLWLQIKPQFCGNWVPARLLEDLIYPEFAGSISGGDTYTWRPIAKHFVKLPGVWVANATGELRTAIPRPTA